MQAKRKPVVEERRVEVLSDDGDLLAKLESVCDALNSSLNVSESARSFGKAVLHKSTIIALIDVVSIKDSFNIPQLMRMASCHVPFIAVLEEDPEEEDELYDAGYNGFVLKKSGRQRYVDVLSNFVE